VTQVTQGAVSTVSQARTGPMPTGGRWGWYRDHEGNEFRRVSKLITKVETDTYNLDQWKLRQVAEGLAIRDDLVLAVKAMGRPDPVEGWSKEQKDKIGSIVKDAQQAAKQRDGARSGTAYHDLTERVDRGEAIDDVVRGLPAKAAETLRAYAFLRRENGWVNVEVERTVVCDELECAGTFDRVDLVPGLAKLLGPGDCQYGHAPGDHGEAVVYDGELPVTVDVKTEAAPWLNGLHIGPQLAIYSRARRMWRPTGGMVPLLDKEGKPKTYPTSGNVIMIPDGEYVPAPCVRQDVAVVVHLLDGHAVPYFINLTEGWEAARAAYEQTNREARAKRGLGAAGAWFAEVPGVKRPAVAQMLVEQAAAAGYAQVRPAPEYKVGDTATVAGIEFTKHSEGPTGEQVAVRDPQTGLVSWQPVVPAAAATLDEIDAGAIRVIWQATSVEALGVVWETYTGEQVGRTWAGPVAQAADARRRQIECPQRALHAGGGKCACGWTPAVPA
jgi:hypothetical protein